MGLGLVTDLYELNMATSYLRRGMTASATFSLFVRELPPERGYLVAAGLDDALRLLADYRFDDDELAWLSGHGFETEAIDALRHLRFTGDVWAIPEGHVVFPDEPLLEVTAPLPEAQLVETLLLNQLTFQTALATKAARCRVAAGGRAALVDFALRRTHGIEAGMAAARVTAIAGFAGTSNVEAARRLGVTAVGTMAHSYIQAFGSERDAFTAFAADFPHRTTFLVDTYDTLGGVELALEVAADRPDLGQVGVRLDSGDLLELSSQTRALLDAAGRPDIQIVASGGLDEFDVQRLLDAGAPIDAFGVGTRVGVSADAPILDSAYKLVEYDGRPVMKLSEGKETRPGPKQLYRGDLAVGDLLATRDEPPPPHSQPLLEPVMSGGRRLASAEPVEVAAQRLSADLDRLPASVRDLRAPATIPLRVSRRLEELTREVSAAHRHPPTGE